MRSGFERGPAPIAVALALFACAGRGGAQDDTQVIVIPDDVGGDGAAAGDGATGDGTAAATDGEPADDTTALADGGSDAGGTRRRGPGPALPKAYTGGTCPTLSGGDISLISGDKKRTVKVYLPDDMINPGLLFLWHGLGDTASAFANYAAASTMATKHHLAIVVPQSADALGWGYVDKKAEAADAALFDDLLACGDAQWDIDNTRVYTMGFSAGALWSTWLVVHRAEYLAAAAIFSGGTDGFITWHEPAYPLPVLAVWGGASDTAVRGMVEFEPRMTDLVAKLKAAGHVVVGCNHGLGHTVPMGAIYWAYPFLAAHVWKDGSSPFSNGPSGVKFPNYCEVPVK